MKKTLLIIFLAFSLMATAQTDVLLNIHHKLGTADFQMNTAAENNIGHQFNVKRLEYYIAEISIIHDGGTETPMTDVYILANAENPLLENLGNYNITDVEGIKFHIGVDEIRNHEDPTKYRVTHPLGPKSPSMHWGWAAGYRFLAFEGFGGAGFNREFQIHALGDTNYFQRSIDVSASAVDGVVTIDLDADYSRILENISVENGLINHGETGPAITSLENFRDYVFSVAGTSSTKDLAQITEFEIFPNPATNGLVTIDFNSLEKANYQIQISNLLGQIIQISNIENGKSSIQLNSTQKGIYLIGLIKEGAVLTTKKLVIE